MTTLTSTQLDGRDVILTAGMIVDGRKIAGIFGNEADARSADADALALGTIAWDRLTPAQQAIAAANSESL